MTAEGGANPASCIMIVDDDGDIRALVVDALSLRGYSVVAARDGADALEKLRAGLRPRVILLDLMMPGMSGWQFRSQQSSDPAIASIPIVVLTGDDGTIADKARSLGAADYLRKPVELRTLVSTVARFC